MRIIYQPVFSIAVLFLTDFASCLPANPDATAAVQPAPPIARQSAQEPPKSVFVVEQKDVGPKETQASPPDSHPKDFPIPLGVGSPEKGVVNVVQVGKPELHKDDQPAALPAPNVAEAGQGQQVKIQLDDPNQKQPHADDKGMLVADGKPAANDQKLQQDLVDQEGLELPDKNIQDDDSIKAMEMENADEVHANDLPLVQNWQKPELPLNSNNNNPPSTQTKTWSWGSWSMEYVVIVVCLAVITVLLVWRRFWYAVCTSCRSRTYGTGGMSDHVKVAYKPL